MEIAGIKRISAADEAFKTLHDMIMSGELQNGDKLPSQDKLALQFAVSRNTIREAINKLTVMGLLTARQGIGTVVNISSPSNYMTSLADHILLHPATVKEFLEARFIIERAAVHLVVLRATPEDIDELKAIVQKQKEALRKGRIEDFVMYDVAFHIALSRASGNQVLWKFLETVTELLNRFIREVSLLPGAMQNAFTFHSEIIALIRSRDADGAERKLTQHLMDVAKNIEKSTGIVFGNDFPFTMHEMKD